ncbi:MAG: PilZ domain-containing protein [Lachnospiraceae bacterium]|nr:PilZ domain-containing protein [Lachnospiraceae bacterium]
MGIDKRKYKRLPIHLELSVSHLYNQEDLDKPVSSQIEVVDVSKSGIGFVCPDTLPLGYYFNATLNLGNEENIIKVVIKIIRSMLLEDGRTHYGCEIVALPFILEEVVDNYEEILDEN